MVMFLYKSLMEVMRCGKVERLFGFVHTVSNVCTLTTQSSVCMMTDSEELCVV
jgi:hypothetical protein